MKMGFHSDGAKVWMSDSKKANRLVRRMEKTKGKPMVDWTERWWVVHWELLMDNHLDYVMEKLLVSLSAKRMAEWMESALPTHKHYPCAKLNIRHYPPKTPTPPEHSHSHHKTSSSVHVQLGLLHLSRGTHTPRRPNKTGRTRETPLNCKTAH
jgi:hypothetical protein